MEDAAFKKQSIEAIMKLKQKEDKEIEAPSTILTPVILPSCTPAKS